MARARSIVRDLGTQLRDLDQMIGALDRRISALNRSGISGDSTSWESWSHVREYNDVDTDTLAAAEDLLDSWPGTLIVVSHDRCLLERVADQQYAILDGRLAKQKTERRGERGPR